jgi:CHAT domain-containing protein
MREHANVLVRLGRVEEAAQLYERVLALQEGLLGPAHPDTASARRKLAHLRLELGRPDEAWELALRGTRDALAWLCEVFDLCSELDRFQYAAEQRWAVDTLRSVAAARPSAERERAAYEAFLAWKGIVFRALSRERREIPPAERATRDELHALRRRMAALLWSASDGDRGGAAGEIARLRERREELESRLARASARTAPPAAKVELLRASLPAGSALLDFHVGKLYEPASAGERVPGGWSEERVCAWVLRPEAELVRVELGPAEPLRALVEDFLLDAVARRGRAVEAAEATRAEDALRERLWLPLAGALGDASLVIVSPDGFLGSLPLEMLTDERGQHLIEARAFCYLQDASSLVDLVRRPPPERIDSLVLVGDLDYDAPREGAAVLASARPDGLRGALRSLWLPLPESGREVETLAELARRFLEPAPRTLVLGGPDVSEQRLEDALPGADVVHLATHGFFQPEGAPSAWDAARERSTAEGEPLESELRLLGGSFPGLLSGLVLAGANGASGTGGEDGLWTADEVGWLDLDGCRLVVLSACETGLGTTRGGEGMMSLRRAFHQAGARSVVSSLWRVRDEETVELMTGFYRRLWERGQGASDALRGARLEMLERNRARYRGDARPSSWGAFVLSGDWR